VKANISEKADEPVLATPRPSKGLTGKCTSFGKSAAFTQWQWLVPGSCNALKRVIRSNDVESVNNDTLIPSSDTCIWCNSLVINS
jgi:hypothetical protein